FTTFNKLHEEQTLAIAGANGAFPGSTNAGNCLFISPSWWPCFVARLSLDFWLFLPGARQVDPACQTLVCRATFNCEKLRDKARLCMHKNNGKFKIASSV